MRGGSFRRRITARTINPTRFFDPHPHRTATRITNVYATTWQLPETQTLMLRVPTEELRLGRVGYFYEKSTDQLPRTLRCESLDISKISFNRFRTTQRNLTAAKLWLFVTPSLQIVAGLTFDTNLQIRNVIDLLEDCYYLDIRIEENTFEAHISSIVSQLSIDSANNNQLLPERHQIAFGPPLPENDNDDLIQRVIYRQDLPYRKQYSTIKYPAELNRRPGNTVAVGPYVSAICGHQNDVENCAVLSAAQAVASAARLREIRQAAHDAVTSFRHVEQSALTINNRRRTLEQLTDKLTDLELELSYSVETPADIGLLVPSLRIESFHTALFDSMNLSRRADIAARMLERLERSINAELTSVQSIERRNDEDRRLRWAVAVGFVSTVAIPLTIVFGYFGMNSTEVHPDRSMFNGRYIGVYVTISLILMASTIPSLTLYIKQRRRDDD